MQYLKLGRIVPAAAVAVGDVGEPDMFFWSSSDDSKLAELCRSGRPKESLLDETDEPAPALDADELPAASLLSFPLFPYLFYIHVIS